MWMKPEIGKEACELQTFICHCYNLDIWSNTDDLKVEFDKYLVMVKDVEWFQSHTCHFLDKMNEGIVRKSENVINKLDAPLRILCVISVCMLYTN